MFIKKISFLEMSLFTFQYRLGEGLKLSLEVSPRTFYVLEEFVRIGGIIIFPFLNVRYNTIV